MTTTASLAPTRNAYQAITLARELLRIGLSVEKSGITAAHVYGLNDCASNVARLASMAEEACETSRREIARGQRERANAQARRGMRQSTRIITANNLQPLEMTE